MTSSGRAVNPKVLSAPTFMWVDYQENDGQNPISSKQKHAFLQKNYQRKKKQASIERLKSSTPGFKQRLSFRYKSPSDSSDRVKTEKRSPVPVVAGEGGSLKTLKTEVIQSTSMQVARITEPRSPRAYLGQGFVDPFSTSAVTMTDTMNSYFHHFKNHTVSQCYPLDSTRMSMWWWQKAVSQPAVLQALLCSTASHQRAVNTLNGVSSESIRGSTREYLRLRGDTMKTLNGILQDSMKAVADSTTLVIGSLIAIEAISASFEAVGAHLKGLKRLIQLQGGLDALDHMTLSKVYQSDVLGAAVTNSRPTFPLTSKWRSEILQETRVFQSGDFLFQFSDEPEIYEALSSLGISFFRSPWCPKLDPSMKTFLHVFRRLIQYYEVAHLRPSVVMPTDNDLFLLFEHQLVSISYAEEDILDEPLRICLLIYINIRMWHLQSFPLMRHLVKNLRQSLLPRLTYLQETAPSLLFWILFIGGMASQGHQWHPWFVCQLGAITRHLGLSQWGEARSVLDGFFYNDHSGDTLAEDLWNELLMKEKDDYA